jgi:hypothetical protein
MVKEGQDVTNLDATQNWSVTNTDEFLSTYAERVISFQWYTRGLCMSIRISSRTWWIMLIIRDGNALEVNGKTMFIHDSDEHNWWNGLNGIIYLFVIVVTSIEFASCVNTYST